MIKNVLLAVHAKKSKPLDLTHSVLDYVNGTYGKKASSDVSDDVEEVQNLRNSVIAEAHTLYDQRELLVKYYRILTAMESRFPISKTPGHVNLAFTWNDAFRDRKSDSQSNIHFEKAAIMFNIGAVVSQLALSIDRKTENGPKESARFFQDAAGSFAHMRDHACLKIDTPRPIDMSFECATMLERLMLAQAQECVLEKAVRDQKSPALQARLCKQIAIYYDECARILTSKPLSDHFDKSWQAHATVKSLLYHLEADLQNAAALRTEDDLKGVANEISRLRAASSVLISAKKEARNASKELQESVTAKEEAIKQRLTKAEWENGSIYLQRVPDVADLPAIVPASVVKSLYPSDVQPTPENQQMFMGVVPETSAKSISRYTEMVDSLIRKQTSKLDAASDEARIKLRELELPESLQALEAGSTVALPDAVRIELEEIEEIGGLRYLHEVMNQIKELRNVASAELDAAEAELSSEARDDEELRAHYGARWKVQPSSQLTAVMRDKLKGYKTNIAVACESDNKLELKLNTELLEYALSPDMAARQMPGLQAPMLSVDNMEPANAVATLRHALDGMSTLSSQRASLEEALKERKNSDNILPRLLSGSGENPEALFKSELAKYDDLVKEVEDNMSKQQQLLQAIVTNDRIFKSTYGFSAWRKSCDDAASAIRVQAKIFKEIKGNLTEGVRFYTSLQDAITALRQQVGDHCMTRRLQRDDLLAELKKAADEQEAQALHRFNSLKLQEQQQQQQQQQYPPQGYQQQQQYPSQPPPSYGYAPPQQPSTSSYNQQQHPPPMTATASGAPPQYPKPHYQTIDNYGATYGAPPPPPSAQNQQQGYVGSGYSAPPPQQQQQPQQQMWPPQQNYAQQQQQQPGYYGQQQQVGYPQGQGQIPPPPPSQQQQQDQQRPNPLGGIFGWGR